MGFFLQLAFKDLIELDKTCRNSGGQATAGHDDIFVQVPLSVDIPAVMMFSKDILHKC